MRALLIGYEGYQGRMSNPAATVATALNGCSSDGCDIVGASMPVALNGLQERLRNLLQLHRPDMVLGLGLWPGESVIRIEQLAYNRAEFELPDNQGVVARGERLVPDGPVALEATVPTETITAALLGAGIPARCSQTAGTFLCNAMLYLLLDMARRTYPDMQCGFVHLPYLPAQVAELLRTIDDERSIGIYQRADLASMDEAVACRALLSVVRIALAGEPPSGAGRGR